MILPIDDEYRIEGDRYSWSIQKARLKNGETTWESFNWFNSIEHAVNHLGEMMVRTSEAQILGEALAEIERVTTLLTHALSTKFEVIRKVKIDDGAGNDK